MPRLFFRLPAFSLVALCLAASACIFVSAQTPAPAYQTNPKYLSAMSDARQLTKGRQLIFAEEAYKKANKLAAGQDPRCLKELYEVQVNLGQYKEAASTATQLESIATSPAEKATAQLDRGMALFRQAGEKGKTELLQAADVSFKAAIASDPKSGTAHFFDGRILARLGQLDAASEQFKQCLSCISPKDPAYLRAQHFAENPALSTAKFAPAFEVVALDGQRFALDAMGGRVVLIDFWATWCGPCNEELPHLKKIAKEFAGQPLVIISVSWDDDESKWKNFINKNEMTWTQYRDADHKLSKSFGVEAIPHYFTIDSDGVLTAEMLGSGSDVEGKLKKLIAKAKAKATPASDKLASN
ncbi:redoxin family protein [Granulicella sp. dw_53]|uniref:redoxin family protein n=1 Tax=Granulicella sp. dw_53 TaxID=2719792 RepID=UPI001BD1BE87|nr:redoxin family protein [Granulicella sp. dw_53]